MKTCVLQHNTSGSLTQTLFHLALFMEIGHLLR